MTLQRGLFFTVFLAAFLCVATASATPLTFAGSSGHYSASASFVQSGNNLIVTLANTSLFDVLVPSDVLTAVFFDYDGSPLSLTRWSAVLAPGSATVGGAADSGGVVGGEWAYRDGLGPHAPASYGISSTGLGLFGPHDLFPGHNLQGPVDPAGVQYGLTSPVDNPHTANGGLGKQALIESAVQFTLKGLPAGFQVSRLGDVSFQYGTSLCEPRIQGHVVSAVPEPGSFGMLALGFAGLATVWFKRRQ